MSYTITPAIRAAAKREGVTVKPSTRPAKKLDAFIDGVFVRAFGATGYGDFHVYLRTEGRESAEKHRRSYHARHAKDASVKYAPDGKLSAGWLAAKILW
jgi:hypothetical protein